MSNSTEFITLGPKQTDISGMIVGRLTVLGPVERKKFKGTTATIWLCKCQCGNFTRVERTKLTNKRTPTRSCGCLVTEENISRSTHGMAETAEYSVWSGMIQRCTNANAFGYENYGGRGISVCDRWLNSFELFFADMGSRPSSKHELDRKDNNGNYEPGNCRWATIREQSLNKRTNRLLTFKGETLPLVVLAAKYNLERATVAARLSRGWTIADALTTPLKQVSWHHQ